MRLCNEKCVKSAKNFCGFYHKTFTIFRKFEINVKFSSTCFTKYGKNSII